MLAPPQRPKCLLFNGCFKAVAAALLTASVDMILTDPPYGETSLAWDRWVSNWPAAISRVLKPTGSMWVFGSTRMFLALIAATFWYFPHVSVAIAASLAGAVLGLRFVSKVIESH